MSETVKDVVAAYRHGEMTLDQLADNLAGRTWPKVPTNPDLYDWEWAPNQDTFAPGTWSGDVYHLVNTGDLTFDEYETILQRRIANAEPD